MFKIANRPIGNTHPPFIIAEMSGNHNNSLDRAIKLVDAAAEAGADAIKLQTYTADSLTLNIRKGAFLIKDKKSLWHGKTLYELYKNAATPWDWHGDIIKRAEQKGLICFSSPFDDESVDFLEGLGIKAYKIASPEIVDIGLIRKIANTGKPTIMSTGMASLQEIDEAVSAFRNTGNHNLALLQCTSAYPAEPKYSNLATIANMREIFNCEVGLSDHTMGIGAAVASVALGASMIEKHFTLARADGGVDAAFSLEPHELKQLVIEAKNAYDAIGKVAYGPTVSEQGGLLFRRSLYICEDIKKGERFTRKNVKSIRPGDGLHPRFLEIILQHKAKTDLVKGMPVRWDML